MSAVRDLVDACSWKVKSANNMKILVCIEKKKKKEKKKGLCINRYGGLEART